MDGKYFCGGGGQPIGGPHGKPSRLRVVWRSFGQEGGNLCQRSTPSRANRGVRSLQRNHQAELSSAGDPPTGMGWEMQRQPGRGGSPTSPLRGGAGPGGRRCPPALLIVGVAFVSLAVFLSRRGAASAPSGPGGCFHELPPMNPPSPPPPDGGHHQRRVQRKAPHVSHVSGVCFATENQMF